MKTNWDKKLTTYTLITCLSIFAVVIIMISPKFLKFNNEISPEAFVSASSQAENIQISTSELANYEQEFYSFTAPQNIDVKVNFESSADISNVTTQFKLVVDPLKNSETIENTNACLVTAINKDECFANSYFDNFIDNTSYTIVSSNYIEEINGFAVLVQDDASLTNYGVVVKDDAYITFKINEKMVVYDLATSFLILENLTQR